MFGAAVVYDLCGLITDIIADKAAALRLLPVAFGIIYALSIGKAGSTVKKICRAHIDVVARIFTICDIYVIDFAADFNGRNKLLSFR